jgi:hypothetical protein
MSVLTYHHFLPYFHAVHAMHGEQEPMMKGTKTSKGEVFWETGISAAEQRKGDLQSGLGWFASLPLSLTVEFQVLLR